MQDAVVVPVGGGGLIAGMALFLKHINPRIQVSTARCGKRWRLS